MSTGYLGPMDDDELPQQSDQPGTGGAETPGTIARGLGEAVREEVEGETPETEEDRDQDAGPASTPDQP